MPGEPVQIGPFLGGLNTFSDPTAVADNQLVVCDNFELDLDGSLVSRPPIAAMTGMTLGSTGNPELLGYYFGTFNSAYLIATNGLNQTYYWDQNTTAWVSITNTIAAAAMIQFNGRAYLIAPQGSSNPGGYWTPGGGFVADANMPKGDAAAVYKSRMWIAPGKNASSNGTRLYYSDVLGSSPLWPASPDFIDVGSGDGENIVQITTYYSSLIIMRTHSIYAVQYSAEPSNAIVSLVVPGVGITDKNCLVPFENYLYFMYDDKAYEFVNNRAAQINVQVPFKAGSRANIYQPNSVSKFNRRIIFSYWDMTFVFNLRTRTWTTWTSPTRGSLGKLIELDDATNDLTAILFSNNVVPAGGTRVASTLTISDSFGSASEDFSCTLQTKNYNYEIGSAYKRLFWWGIEAVFRGEVKGGAYPIQFTTNGTWGQILQQTWGQLLQQTWGALTFDAYRVETTRDTTGSGAMRKFVKFLKSLRFRQIYYKVIFDTDGTLATAPVRLFLLITYVSAKQRVSKTVT